MNDPFAISLKFWAKNMGRFGMFAAESVFAFGSEATEKGAFPFFPLGTGTDRHSSGMDGSGGESRDGEN